MVRAVLFDMDGTLLDTQRIYNECWRYAARKLSFAGDIEADILAFSGKSRADAISYFKEKYGEKVDIAALFLLRDAYEADMMERMGLYCKPGVREALEQLRKMGIRCAVATGTNLARTTGFLRKTGIFEYFDAFLTGERVAHSKPHPEIFLRAAEAVGCAPFECVVVEDSYNGIRAGKAAGMRVVMVPDLQPPTEELRAMLWHCLDSMDALPSLIETENKKMK